MERSSSSRSTKPSAFVTRTEEIWRCEASALADGYAAGCAKLCQSFNITHDPVAYLRSRSALVDSVVFRLYSLFFSPDLSAPAELCLAATGGYGRQELFPYSDVDLLFIFLQRQALEEAREAMAAFSRGLWDMRMRVGQGARTLAECGRLEPGNLQFSVSLLDLRYLAGDRRLFEALRSQAIPRLVARDQHDLVRSLVELTERRHARHGKTVFQLEPDVKEAPGGLRDYYVARWISQIGEIAQSGKWIEGSPALPFRQALDPAFRFLSSVRCFLHHERGRNDNLVTYELQEQASARGLGTGGPAKPERWMREYFLYARSIHRGVVRSIDDVLTSRSSLYAGFQSWMSRLSNAEFSVVRGRILPREPASRQPSLSSLLNLFEMVARHGLDLSAAAETWVEESLEALRLEQGSRGPALAFPGPDLAAAFRRILSLPHAADALRGMHRAGLLVALFPEFAAIDALVIRDFYHRFTVDEHSFMAVESLCGLMRNARDHPDEAEPEWEWVEAFAGLYTEVEQRDLLSLALLFHDVGKGMDVPDHIQGSLLAASEACSRLRLARADEQTLVFLIARHLEMVSTMMRRDIFDPETVRAFAERVGTTERLKMLCLLTYADMRAVNREALTPWKMEMLWQLYTMAFNYLSRSLDQDRLPAAPGFAAWPAGVLSFLETIASPDELSAFLEGFPRRYLATYSEEEIAGHFELARKVPQHPVQARVRWRSNFAELTVIAPDRPRLFALVTGTLAAWGMNILKAEAFANQAGLVLDVFRFHDLHRTLELNASELSRLEQTLVEVLTGRVSLEPLIAGRLASRKTVRAKLHVPTRISFDDTASSRCTLLEVVTQDRPGLVYRLSAILAGFGCNIEIALIDTQAEKASDVFYLTTGGQKLPLHLQEAIRQALLDQLY